MFLCGPTQSKSPRLHSSTRQQNEQEKKKTLHLERTCGRCREKGENLVVMVRSKVKENRCENSGGELCVEQWLIQQFRFNCCEGRSNRFSSGTTGSSCSGADDLQSKSEGRKGRRWNNSVKKIYQINSDCDPLESSKNMLKKGGWD